MKRGTITPVCHAKGTVPDVYPMLQRHVNRDSCTSRPFRSLGQISSTPGLLLLLSCLTAPVIGEPKPKSSSSASSSECMLVRLWRSSKSSFQCLTIDSVEVSNFPPTLKTVWTGFYFSLLSCQTVFQNIFCADWKPFSMASSNSSHNQVFVSVTSRR